MEKALLTAGIVVVPTMLLVIAFRLSGRKVEWAPLLWAGFAFLVYFLLLRSKGVIPAPHFMQELTLNWFGKTMSIAGTIMMLYFLPSVSYRSAGVIRAQNNGSLKPVLITGGIVLLVTTGSAMLVATTPNTALENLLFQATLPGLDEELFMRGLALLLFHQAFGKGLKVWGAHTGWGFWLAVTIFGLLHGVTVQSGELAFNLWAILGTGFIGFVLTWMREVTGSLMAPILFHNVSNVAQAFV
jgi:membrane protease YdiL (CAAX protease family)